MLAHTARSARLTGTGGRSDSLGSAIAAAVTGCPDTGEQCDAGVLNGTLDSCCSATCRFTNAGTPCTDTLPGGCWNFVD